VIVLVPVPPEYVNSILEVPVVEKFVTVLILKTVALLPVTTILDPDPKVKLLVFELELIKLLPVKV